MNLNMEWHSIYYVSILEKFLLFLFLLTPLAVLLRRSCFKNWGFFECSLFILAFHLLTQHLRTIPYTAILLSYPLAVSSKAILEYLYDKMPHFLSFLKRAYSFLNLQEERGISVHWYAAALLFAIFCYSPSIFAEKDAYGSPTPTYCPQEAIKYLVNIAKEKPLKVYASPNNGGCLTFFGNKKVLAIIDDRNTMLGEKRYKDYIKFCNRTKDFRRLLKKQNADYTILDLKEDKKIIDELHRQKIEEVYKNDTHIVFSVPDIVLSTPKNEKKQPFTPPAA